MTEKVTKNKPQGSNPISLIITLAIVVALVSFIVKDMERAWGILIVLLGFGAVIFIHEFGHFIAAKSVGIFVEEFSIGMGHIVLGVKKLAGGLQIRVLPGLLSNSEGNPLMVFKIPAGFTSAGDTEYQLRLIPLGGFVKMLGQEDLGADKPSDDPRSFSNKPFFPRALTISAGVVMNVISAAIAFMFIYSVGIKLPPAIVGDVIPGMPAAEAGLGAGDEILAINGKENNLNFTDLFIAGAFSSENNPARIKVRDADGTIKDITVNAEMDDTLGFRRFGILPATSLNIARPGSREQLEALKELGFHPGDKVVAVNGQPVETFARLKSFIKPSTGSFDVKPVDITVSREVETQRTEHTVTIPMALGPVGKTPASVLGMVPRLQASSVVKGSPADKAGIQAHDIFVQIATISTPTSRELVDTVKSHASEPLKIVVRREEDGAMKDVEIRVTPKVNRAWWQFFMKVPATIGVGLANWDLQNAIVADCIAYDEEKDKLSIPRGARITAINDQPVSNWLDIIRMLKDAKGEDAVISYAANGNSESQQVIATVPDNTDWIGFAPRPDLEKLNGLPFKEMQKTYKASGMGEALAMGLDTTRQNIVQTYLTIKGMLTQQVSLKSASGPVGILKMSFTVASEKTFVDYLNWMALISIAIAVFNFLPLPILDGGLIVMLIIEKIKGSPISLRTQEIINYVGLVLIGTLFLYITYNDIVKVATGVL